MEALIPTQSRQTLFFAVIVIYVTLGGVSCLFLIKAFLWSEEDTDQVQNRVWRFFSNPQNVVASGLLHPRPTIGQKHS